MSRPSVEQRDESLLHESGDARTWQVTTVWTCTARVHDTLSAGKNAGCSCPSAGKAVAAYEKRRRCGRTTPVDPTGTVRRLRALAAIGYTAADLSRRLGMGDAACVRQIWEGKRAKTTRRIADAVRDLYAELEHTPGPSRLGKTKALHRGWLPPAWWDVDTIDDPAADPAAPDLDVVDEVKLDRVLAGESLCLTKVERHELARRVYAEGGTVNDVAKTLRMNGTYARRLLEEISGEVPRTVSPPRPTSVMEQAS